MKKAFSLGTVFLYFILNLYIANKYFQLCQIVWPNVTLLTIGMILVSACCTAILYSTDNKNVGVFIGRMGNYWQGFLLINIMLFGVSDIFLYFIRLLGDISTKQNRIIQVVQIVGVLLFALFYLLIGRWQAKRIQKTTYTIKISKNIPLETMKLVFVSDLHLGYVQNEKFLGKLVKQINELQPDVVCIVGDLFDNNVKAIQQPEKIVALLNQIQGKYGVYLCWGNHDAGGTFEEMKKIIKETSIQLLEDELVEIKDLLLIAGRRDATPFGNQGGKRKDWSEISQGNEKLPILVMDHQPSSLSDYETEDLIICGHTHHGQVFPLNFITRALFEVDYGYYQKNADSPQVIVSSGVGTAGPPIRIGTKSEIVEITLTFSKKEETREKGI